MTVCRGDTCLLSSKVSELIYDIRTVHSVFYGTRFLVHIARRTRFFVEKVLVDRVNFFLVCMTVFSAIRPLKK